MPVIDPAFHYGPADHRAYQHDGYRIFPGFLTPEGLASCRERVDALIAGLTPGHSPEEIISAHQVEPWLLDLAAEPRLLDMIECQIGSDILLWSTHLLCKPPRSGKEVPWHQDAPYWNVGGPFPGAVWISLDDVDEANGAMSILPGWHNRGVLPRRIGGEQFFNQDIDPQVLPADCDRVRVQYLVTAGTMAIHDPMLPHTSVPNRSDRWRRVIILRYMTASGSRGEKTYRNPHTGAAMPREYLLMRGTDPRGLAKPPALTTSSSQA